MNYREALAWLYSLQRFGIKLGLDNIRRLLGSLALPRKEQRIVHVAGTNGKGSVCAMLDSILRAQGYRTGLFTSPHLVTFRERIRVNGEMISEEAVAEYLTSIRKLVSGWELHPTFFEIVTALALLHFRDALCDFIVLETGLGGRLDATNAVQPIVSVITPIALDHQQWLGSSLAEIASEKAGIIKPHAPVVSASQPEEAARVIRDRAAECEAPLEFVSSSYSYPLSLAGSYQKENAALAITALRATGIAVTEKAIAQGLAHVEWPARFQQWDERTVIDGAHNPAGAKVLASTWRETFGDKRAAVILSVLEDKDAAGIWRELSPIAVRALLPLVRSERALPSHQLEKIVTSSASTPILVATYPSFHRAWVEACHGSCLILITGSLHFAGEALAELRGQPAAFEECAQ